MIIFRNGMVFQVCTNEEAHTNKYNLTYQSPSFFGNATKGFYIDLVGHHNMSCNCLHNYYANKYSKEDKVFDFENITDPDVQLVITKFINSRKHLLQIDRDYKLDLLCNH